MTITINYSPKPSDGYTPRKAQKIYNVSSVHDVTEGSISVRFLFSDQRPVFDHVVSVVVITT